MNVEEWGIEERRKEVEREEAKKTGVEKTIEIFEALLFVNKGDMAECRRIIDAWLREAELRYRRNGY
ncbi:MAG: hypothetical protein M1423_07710 [Acidobacteria bacterium]|nr:hypothetical protein [Acidobacteriota bacterium]